MENEVRFMEFEGVQVAAFIEWHTTKEHSSYHPENVIFYVVQGQLHIRIGHDLHTIGKGEFCLVRKFTKGTYFKSWSKEENCAKVNAMILQDHLIQEAIRELKIEPPTNPIKGAVIPLKSNVILKGLYDSLITYMTDNEGIDKDLLRLKTKEALLGILKSNADYLAIFSQIYQPKKADLEEFLNHHIALNIPLKELAKLSGRSLSSFNREFNKLFRTTPHRWILKKRLNMAKELLLTTDLQASQIYLQVGFKDLAHFSRTFKKEFGKTPTQIRKGD